MGLGRGSFRHGQGGVMAVNVKTTQWTFPNFRDLPTIGESYYALALGGSIASLIMPGAAQLLQVRIKREPGIWRAPHATTVGGARERDLRLIYEIVVRVNNRDVVPNTMRKNWLTVGPSNTGVLTWDNGRLTELVLEGDLCGLHGSALAAGDQLQVYVRGWDAKTLGKDSVGARFKPFSVEVVYEDLEAAPVGGWDEDPFELGRAGW